MIDKRIYVRVKIGDERIGRSFEFPIADLFNESVMELGDKMCRVKLYIDDKLKSDANVIHCCSYGTIQNFGTVVEELAQRKKADG